MVSQAFPSKHRNPSLHKERVRCKYAEGSLDSVRRTTRHHTTLHTPQGIPRNPNAQPHNQHPLPTCTLQVHDLTPSIKKQEDQHAEPLLLAEHSCKGLSQDYKIDGSPYDPPSLTQHIVNAVAPQQVRPLREVPPELSQLHDAFLRDAAVAVEEEGPVGFIDTWYLMGPREYVTEQSRLLQLDQYADEWEAAIRELWADEIDNNLPLHMHWVTPIPEALIGRDRLGHLILKQAIPDHLTAVHFTMRFQGLGRTAVGFAAALLHNPVALHQQKTYSNLLGFALAGDVACASMDLSGEKQLLWMSREEPVLNFDLASLKNAWETNTLLNLSPSIMSLKSKSHSNLYTHLYMNNHNLFETSMNHGLTML